VFEVTSALKAKLIKLDSGGDDQLRRNQTIARRELAVVLYIRVYIFRIFLQCALKVGGELKNEHKMLWLLLQVGPCALGFRDFFKKSLVFFENVDYKTTERKIEFEMTIITKILGGDVPLFCVIDEAQILAAKPHDYFRAESEPWSPRPVLGEIIYTCLDLCSKNLLISGTGLSIAAITDVMASAASKIPFQWARFTDLGAFDGVAGVRRYFERYVPYGFFSNDKGEMLLTRMTYWLHGR
jgi:hypothetical protein